MGTLTSAPERWPGPLLSMQMQHSQAAIRARPLRFFLRQCGDYGKKVIGRLLSSSTNAFLTPGDNLDGTRAFIFLFSFKHAQDW